MHLISIMLYFVVENTIIYIKRFNRHIIRSLFPIIITNESLLTGHISYITQIGLHRVVLEKVVPLLHEV